MAQGKGGAIRRSGARRALPARSTIAERLSRSSISAIRRALLDEPEVAFHYCGDPAAAITIAKEIKPTVILQDLLMPGVNGLDLVRQYRADPATSAIPIIVLSTKEEPKVKSDAFKAGANDYLVKLPDRIELIARIRYHSKAYMAQLQRDEAYRALRESQQKLLEMNFELQSLSNADGLTGLSNRRFFNEYMEAEWKRGVRSKSPLSILMIDVDHFKPFNDTYGHVADDEILKRVAQAIKQSCRRSTDLAARYGGEEFAVILPVPRPPRRQALQGGGSAAAPPQRLPGRKVRDCQRRRRDGGSRSGGVFHHLGGCRRQGFIRGQARGQKPHRHARPRLLVRRTAGGVRSERDRIDASSVPIKLALSEKKPGVAAGLL